jgi:hypothetical protein
MSRRARNAVREMSQMTWSLAFTVADAEALNALPLLTTLCSTALAAQHPFELCAPCNQLTRAILDF